MRGTDFNDWYIELFEDFQTERKEQLNKREGEIIREIGTLNKNIAGRTNKEYKKEYEKNNKDKKEHDKEYNQKNEDKRKNIMKLIKINLQNIEKLLKIKKRI